VSLSISALTFSATVKALLPGRKDQIPTPSLPRKQERVVVFLPQFRPTDIFQLDERTIRRGLDYHFLKLGNVCEPANSPEVKLIHLPIYRWLLTDSPSTHLKVLFLNRVNISSRARLRLAYWGLATDAWHIGAHQRDLCHQRPRFFLGIYYV